MGYTYRSNLLIYYTKRTMPKDVYNSHYEKLPNGEVRCIDDEIPFEIPSSWAWCAIGNLVSIRGGKRLPVGATFSEIPTPHIYIRVTEMKNNTLVDTQLKFISENLYQLLKSYTINETDLYLTIAGTIGQVGIVPNKFDGMNLTENAVKLTNIPVNKLYLMYAISSDCVQTQFSARTNKVGQPKLAIERIKTTLLPIPPLSEQQRIVEQIEQILPIVERYDKAQVELDLLNTDIYSLLKKSILQEAIQGRLVPQDPNNEPATKLLERIRTEKQALVKQGKLKAKDITDSIIYEGDDNKYYEQIGNKTIEISEEIPFDIPESWMWCRLSQVVQINPKNKAEDNIEAAFIPMELIDATYFSSFTYETRKWRTIKSGFTHFADGDIAFAKITPCFQNRKSMILQNLPNGIGAGTTELKVLRPYAKTINDFYLLFFLESAYFVEQATFKGTANQQRIISGYMENKLFPLPPIDEQKRIVERIKELYSKL